MNNQKFKYFVFAVFNIFTAFAINLCIGFIISLMAITLFGFGTAAFICRLVLWVLVLFNKKIYINLFVKPCDMANKAFQATYNKVASFFNNEAAYA